jgi:hypothetical protein
MTVMLLESLPLRPVESKVTVNGCTFSGFELAFAWGGCRTSTTGLDFSDDQRLFARIRQAEVILDFFAGFDFSVVIFCLVELGSRGFGQLPPQ